MYKFLIISFFLAGCTQSSGVLEMGPDTYNISVHAAPARGGVSGAKRLAFEEAKQHCATMDKHLLVKDTTFGPSTHFPGGTVDLTFRCLTLNDKELTRPDYQLKPDIIIENR